MSWAKALYSPFLVDHLADLMAGLQPGLVIGQILEKFMAMSRPQNTSLIEFLVPIAWVCQRKVPADRLYNRWKWKEFGYSQG
jgi:hypothetical protein